MSCRLVLFWSACLQPFRIFSFTFRIHRGDGWVLEEARGRVYWVEERKDEGLVLRSKEG
jgi:hypothetical protein